MIGTTLSATRAIRFTPPNMINPKRITIKAPVINGGI